MNFIYLHKIIMKINKLEKKIKEPRCDDIPGRRTTWCMDYNKQECPKTCYYAKEKNEIYNKR